MPTLKIRNNEAQLTAFLPNAKGEIYTTIFLDLFTQNPLLQHAIKKTFTSTLRQWMYAKSKKIQELVLFSSLKANGTFEYIQTKIIKKWSVRTIIMWIIHQINCFLNLL
jgi:hypothetical protein